VVAAGSMAVRLDSVLFSSGPDHVRVGNGGGVRRELDGVASLTKAGFSLFGWGGWEAVGES